MFTGWPTLTQTYWSVFYRCSHDSLRLFKHIDLFSIGVHTIAYAYPNVKIITAAVDHEVNDKYHIIPGIGKLSGYFWLPRNPLLRSIFISWVCSHWLFINWWKCSPFSITFPLLFHLFETKESITWCFLVDRNIFLRNTGITGFEKFTIYTQPRPQGFSLKKWVGKALGTRLHLHTASQTFADVIYARIVTSARLSCSGPLTDSTNHGNCVSNFPSTWLAIRQWLFNRPIMARTQILVHRWGPRTKGFRINTWGLKITEKWRHSLCTASGSDDHVK